MPRAPLFPLFAAASAGRPLQPPMGCLNTKAAGRRPVRMPAEANATAANASAVPPSRRNAHIIGSTHWQGCYQVHTNLPFVVDGAKSIYDMGSRVVKLALMHPITNYPWNSPDWPDFGEAGYRTVTELAQHPYYKQVFEMDFSVIALVAYSTADWDSQYWCLRDGMTAAREAIEREQFYDLTTHLMESYPGKTFLLHLWEGDWSIRCGDWDAEKPPPQYAFDNMVRWLAARQDGVTRARADFARHHRHRRAAAVYHAAEVNRVGTNMHDPQRYPEMTTHVLPHVALDMVAYSNYDTSDSRTEFRAALEHITAHHVRTPASPEHAVFVSEFGLGQNWYPQNRIEREITNVVEVALDYGCPYIIFWESYCNEHTDDEHPWGCGRCDRQTGQTTDPDSLAGFWLVRPDGSPTWPHSYFRSLFA